MPDQLPRYLFRGEGEGARKLVGTWCRGFLASNRSFHDGPDELPWPLTNTELRALYTEHALDRQLDRPFISFTQSKDWAMHFLKNFHEASPVRDDNMHWNAGLLTLETSAVLIEQPMAGDVPGVFRCTIPSERNPEAGREELVLIHSGSVMGAWDLNHLERLVASSEQEWVLLPSKPGSPRAGGTPWTITTAWMEIQKFLRDRKLCF